MDKSAGSHKSMHKVKQHNLNKFKFSIQINPNGIGMVESPQLQAHLMKNENIEKADRGA